MVLLCFLEENDKDYKGRTEEVALIIKKVTSVTKGRVVLPPFMTHSLKEVEKFFFCFNYKTVFSSIITH